MKYVLLVLEALKAIPQILKLITTIWESMQKWREDALVEETKKAARDGDTRKVEENLGSPRAGLPSGDPDSILRPKKGN